MEPRSWRSHASGMSSRTTRLARRQTPARAVAAPSLAGGELAVHVHSLTRDRLLRRAVDTLEQRSRLGFHAARGASGGAGIHVRSQDGRWRMLWRPDEPGVDAPFSWVRRDGGLQVFWQGRAIL